MLIFSGPIGDSHDMPKPVEYLSWPKFSGAPSSVDVAEVEEREQAQRAIHARTGQREDEFGVADHLGGAAHRLPFWSFGPSVLVW